MITRLVIVAAAIVAVMSASPVNAQNRYRIANPAALPSTTGSIDRSYSADRANSPLARMIYEESSAKGGNAELNNHILPNLGDTAGGPLR